MTVRSFLRVGSGVLAAAVILTSCGDDDAGGARGSDPEPAEGDEPVETVTVAVALESAPFSHALLADELGFDLEEGVDIRIVNGGANTMNIVSSGQADLGMIGVSSPLLAAQEGLDTVSIFSHVGGGSAASLFGTGDVQSPEDCSQIVTLSPGTSIYGFGRYFIEEFDLGIDVLPVGDYAAMYGTLASGRANCAAGGAASFSAQLESGDVHFLIDTREEDVREEYIGSTDFPEATVFGVRDNLEAKRDAIVKVITAFDRAGEYFMDEPTDEVVATLRSIDAIGVLDEATVTADIEGIRPYFAPNDGFISPGSWSELLDIVALFDLDGFDPGSEVVSYDERVDMSYYEAALGGG